MAEGDKRLTAFAERKDAAAEAEAPAIAQDTTIMLCRQQ
jgi:hypothetical protein